MSDKMPYNYLIFLENSKREDEQMLTQIDSFKKPKGNTIEEEKRFKAINELIEFKKEMVRERIKYVAEEIDSYLDTLN